MASLTLARLRDLVTRAAVEPLDAAAIESLLEGGADHLDMLQDAASALRDEGLRRAGRPGVITYSRKVFVPITTLCRDRCHYCVFVDTPNQLLAKRKPAYMSREQILAVVRQGAALGSKEVLFTLGDRPEDRWPEARAWLDAHGYPSTIAYVAAMAAEVVRETGLLPHANPGVMTPEELRLLRPHAPSMGMMLETTSRELYTERGAVHYGSPDKDPAVRLQVLEDAGRERVPFTTGILVGIGETLRDRADSLVAIRDAHTRHGHVQEVIVQNFRAKPQTAMERAADPTFTEYLVTLAVARLALGADMRLQAPPNLSDPAELGALLRSGVDDWGGVSPLTADHVNPERPWPQITELARLTAESGFTLRERLTAHPRYVADETWIDDGLRPAVLALAGDDFLADPAVHAKPTRARAGGTDVTTLAERAAIDPDVLDDAAWETLLRAEGDALDRLAAVADDVRRYTVGEAVSIVVNRNLTSSGLRAVAATPDQFTLADAAAIAEDAWQLGATEVCVQGALPRDVDADGYLDIVSTIRAAAPRLHVHAFRPQDVDDLARRTGRSVDAALAAMRDAGVDTVPGTGVKVLDDDVRRRVAPTDLPVARWIELVTAAHRAGFRSTSVLFYGHVETAADRVAHLRTLLRIQDTTGGFTEFVPIPMPGFGVPLVAGRPAIDEHRAMTAVSRLMLSRRIAHVQTPWTRLGLDAAAVMLRSGADDLGGTLLDGRIRPAAGIEAGTELPLTQAAALARRLFRPLRQRTTDYLEPASDRKLALR